MTTTTAPGAKTSNRRRPRWLTPLIVVCLLLAVTVAVTVLTPGRGNTDELDPANPGRDGVDELTVPFSDLEVLAEEVAGHGADVQVLDPPALREAVLRLLRGVLAGSAAGAERGSAAGAR